MSRHYVKFEQSKGGRNRISPVLNADSVKEILTKFREDEHIFKTINKNIDIHSSRREYAHSLYRSILNDKELRDEYLRQYPKRHDYKTRKNNEGVSVTTKIKGDIYRDRSGNTYLRDDVYIVSQALGHNRLDVTVTHYLK